MSGDHAKREVTVTRVEYAVPSGAEIKDFGLVEEWAWQDCARRNGWDVKGSRDDNWCTVHARDDEVVFAFTVEKTVEVPDNWRGVDLAGAIRQAEESHAGMRKWIDLFEKVKVQRDGKQDALKAIRDLIAEHEDSLPASLAREIRTAIEGAI